jgi:micrococcal nuclease
MPISWFSTLSPTAKALTAAAAALAVGGLGVGVAMVAAPDSDPAAVVLGVVDGDTVDVRYRGEEKRVRLLNVNTPETVDPQKDVECLGPEATRYLEEMLPVGTQVRLEFDEELHDRYDRLLAGVFVNDVLVNAEIARRGLGAAVVYEPNDRFYEQVRLASEEAFEEKVGLYDQTIECTLTGRFTAHTDAVVAASEQVPTTVAEADSLLAEIAALAATSALLRDMVDAPDLFPAAAYSSSALAAWAALLDDTDPLLEDFRREVAAARDAEVQRIEDERRAAEEAARAAAEAEAARAAAEAEAARAAERAAAERAAADAARRSASRPKSSARDSGTGDGSTGGSGYTGCRKYAPGGKTWTPIPCP